MKQRSKAKKVKKTARKTKRKSLKLAKKSARRSKKIKRSVKINSKRSLKKSKQPKKLSNKSKGSMVFDPLDQVSVTCSNCGRKFDMVMLHGLSTEGMLCQRCSFGEIQFPE
jgi:DNA-directed RNA polymerase subunit RPC12/RpoP